METIARLGARLILQQALEAETEVLLGRARYDPAAEPVAYRNGYEARMVRTTSGPIELERPRLRGASELGFANAVLGQAVVSKSTVSRIWEQTRERLPRLVRARPRRPRRRLLLPGYAVPEARRATRTGSTSPASSPAAACALRR